ncbi:bifunctional lysylphosphatidylglycerol flippase/synthetase MprF [Povalibacter sp.]|uniref:bifunctional lysylphosphatidylglycerol flippase/synthetase MprF n=1 Tax=Povalibacter sp. TaxID=1962978 RepID=UPI002F414913
MQPATESAQDKIQLVTTLQRWKPWLIGGAVLLIGLLLADALHGLAAEFSYANLVDAIRATPSSALAWAVAATAISYFALTGYDHSSLRYAGASVPYHVAAQTAFIAYALSNTIGLGVLTGGAVRMRFYSAAGIEAGLISRAIAFNAIAFGLGIAVVGAVALLWGANTVGPALHLPPIVLQAVAATVLIVAATLLVLCRDGREPLLFGRLRLRLPPASLALHQLLISAVDIGATAAVLWVLLPAGSIAFSAFVGFFAIAVVLGVLSHLPGGLGVFEAIMLLALKDHVPAESLAAALVLYRIIYYVLPLLLALALLVFLELQHGAGTAVSRAAVSLAPLLLAAYTIVIGVMLLISGVTPATDEATDLLALHVPLPLVEASHFLGSVAGLGLLTVARGMLLRLDAAWWAGLLIGIASILLCLPKGFALSEMALIACLVIALALSRKQFSRPASLLAQPFTGGWLLSVIAIVSALTGLLFFAYRDIDYTRQLWWQFEFDGHAPRSLRALVAVALLALALAMRQLLRFQTQPLPPVDATAIARAEQVVKAQDSAEACVALTGDKHFLFSQSGDAFVMYGRRGRSWVCLFDPVGPQSEWPELVWRFLELSRAQGGRASFYQVRPQTLPVYLDAGLRVFKLGEYASVPLADFSLKGKSRSVLRQAVNRGEREGLSVEVLDVAAVRTHIDELRAVSNAWLAEHRTAEKGFSLGSFTEDYVERTPVAVVRVGERLVAFATLMMTERKTEASVDLMRHLPDAPSGTMDFLFTKLLLHFQAQGFERFGLGMAPLSGMAEHPLAPGWHRVGRLLFSHGENFYNFRGLRSFKEKFAPEWEARYLAAPGGLAPLFVLADIAALISGGLKGVIAK